MQIEPGEPTLAQTAPTQVANLDLLRCVAVVLVVASHIWFGNYAMAVMGRLGVLFFFVHTALVLMFSLKRLDEHRSPGRLYVDFIIRRVFRIYPLAIVLVLLVSVFSIPSYAYGTGKVFLPSMDDLGLVMNVMLVQDVIVSEGAPIAQIGQLWTLPIEMRMYLVLPVIYLLTKVLPPVRFSLALWVLSIPLAIGSGWAVTRVFGNPIAVFDWGWIQFPRLLEFMPLFVAGVVAATLWPYARKSLPFVVLPVLLASVTAGYYAMIDLVDRGHRLNLYGFFTCMMIALALPFVFEPGSALLRTILATLARYSYGIYLVHLSCIWLGFDKLGGQPVPMQWLVFLTSLAAASFVLYHLVEAPMIQLGKRLAR